MYIYIYIHMHISIPLLPLESGSFIQKAEPARSAAGWSAPRGALIPGVISLWLAGNEGMEKKEMETTIMGLYRV